MGYNKATQNVLKHGVSFEEAASIFDADKILLKKDLKHSILEERKIAIGPSNLNRFLVVILTEREDRIRIISARPAKQKERQQYEQKTT
ncbi:MAG: BrnT family toxin [Candidatus Kapaibacterium sp.]